MISCSHSNIRLTRSANLFLLMLRLALCLSATTRLADAQQVYLSSDASGNLLQVYSRNIPALAIVRLPLSRLAAVGDSVSLSVLAQGSLPLSYQWQLNSNNIPGAAADTLLLTNLTLADFGAYRVIVSNPLGSVTSGNALLQLDSDRDGMADSWEITYFLSITNRSGIEDFDADGVTERNEFLEGTHPRFASVVNPRLTILSDRGEVFVTPSVPIFTNGQVVTLTGVPDSGLQFLDYLAGASGAIYNLRTNPASIRLTSSLTVRAMFGLPLSTALDVTNTWRLDEGGWFGQTNITHDGVDAAQSARMLGVTDAWLELSNVVLNAEGTITFWWKVDGSPADRLRFYRNNLLRTGEIGTNTNWQLRTYYLPAGNNLVRWVYLKVSDEVSEYNGLFYAPLDAGWVDQVTYAVWPDPLRDSDADGMPDIWEFRYFDGIGQAPNGDYDGDGISNLDEYRDGTDPGNIVSYQPRLTAIVTGSGGTVARTPDLPKYTIGQRVQLQAVPDPTNYFVIWDGAVAGTNTTNSLLMNGNKTITAVFGSPLPVALETPALTWTRFGNIGWFGQTNITHDGVDAAQSGPVGFNQQSGMETSMNGPGTLTFWWKASSRTDVSFARFLIDGTEQPGAISGETPWRIQSYYLTPGSHTLRWVYTNSTLNFSITNGVWVDQVSFTAGTIAPTIYGQPVDFVAPQGTSAFFSVMTGGTPPLYYQWFRNGVSLGAAGTNAILSLTSISAAQAGSYSVQVSNAVQKVTSADATLTVLPVPPANDNFLSRTPLITATTALGYTVGATREAAEPKHASTSGGRSIWWSWTAPSTGNFQVQVTATNLASLVAAVYVGNAVGALTEVESGLGTSVPANGINLSTIVFTFPAVAGRSYAVVVDQGGGVAGFVTVSVNPTGTLALGNFNFNAAGSFGFSFSAPAGARYEIQGSNDLITWTTLDAGIVPPNGLISFTDAISSSQASRFYRVVLVP